MSNTPWWSEGARFECQGSGKCCVSHGEYGFVFLTLSDRRRMAKVLKMTTTAFTKKHCRLQDKIWRLKDSENEDCRFLKNKKCSVYHARPTQCRTWPFWPEVMAPKTWAREVASFCPGVGKGRIWSAQEIEKLLKEQQKSENQL